MSQAALADRVLEQTNNTGMSNLSLGGVSDPRYVTWAIGVGDQVRSYYTIVHRSVNQWEIGVGYVLVGGGLGGGDLFVRESVIRNSLGTTAFIDFVSGMKDVFMDVPAEKFVALDRDSAALTLPGALAATNGPSSFAGMTGASLHITGTSTLDGAVTFGSTTTLGGIAYTWPGAQTANRYLKTDGSGHLSWASILETLSLGDLSDVTLTSPQLGQVLMKGASDWANHTLVSADISDATAAATASTLVLRDGAGDFAAHYITANSFIGALSKTLTFGAHLTGTSFNNSANVTIATDASSTSVANTLVARDASGNFGAGSISADLIGTVTGFLVGNASTATKLQNARTINGVSFDGTANITVTADASTLTGAALAGGVAVGLNQVTGLISGGTIATNLLPAIAITDTFVVASQAAMLALTAQTGDVAVRSDLNKSFILKGTNPAVLTDWQELLTPTDAVLSVAGKTGVVTLVSADITDATSTNTANRLVLRDGSGNFAGNTITATAFSAGTVSATGNITTNASLISQRGSGGQLRIYSDTAAGSHQWDIFTNGTDLQLSDNTGLGSFKVPTMTVTGSATFQNGISVSAGGASITGSTAITGTFTSSSTGQFGIFAAAAGAIGTRQNVLIVSPDTNDAQTRSGTIAIATYGTNNPDYLAIVHGGFPNAPATVGITQTLWRGIYAGYDGAAYHRAPWVQVRAAENWTATANGSQIVFTTTFNGTTTNNTALTIDHDKSATFTGTVSAAVTSGFKLGTSSVLKSDGSTVAIYPLASGNSVQINNFADTAANFAITDAGIATIRAGINSTTGNIKATAAGVYAGGIAEPTSGAWAGIAYSAGAGYFYAYDFTGATYKPIVLNGTSVTLSVGGMTISPPAGATPLLTVNGSVGGDYAGKVINSRTTAAAYGLFVQGGTGTGDFGLRVVSAASSGATELFSVRGDGLTTFNGGANSQVFVGAQSSFGFVSAGNAPSSLGTVTGLYGFNGDTNTYINAKTGGAVTLRVNNVEQLNVGASGVTLSHATGATLVLNTTTGAVTDIAYTVFERGGSIKAVAGLNAGSTNADIYTIGTASAALAFNIRQNGAIFTQTAATCTNYAAYFQQSNTTAGSSFGLQVTGGTNSSDRAVQVYNAGVTSTLFYVDGVGSTYVGGNLTVLGSVTNGMTVGSATTSSRIDSTDGTVILRMNGQGTTGYLQTASNHDLHFGAGGRQNDLWINWANGFVVIGTTTTTGAAGGDVIVKNVAGLRSVNAAGTSTLSMLFTDSADRVCLGAGAAGGVGITPVGNIIIKPSGTSSDASFDAGGTGGIVYLGASANSYVNIGAGSSVETRIAKNAWVGVSGGVLAVGGGSGPNASINLDVVNATVTASGGGSTGIYNRPGLVSSANNDTHYGMYVTPTIVTGSGLTGLAYYGVRVGGTKSGTSTIQTAYGLIIDPMPTATTKLAIYVNSSDPVNLGTGSTTIGGPFYMTGSASATSASLRYMSGAGSTVNWYINAGAAGSTYFAIGEVVIGSVVSTGFSLTGKYQIDGVGVLKRETNATSLMGSTVNLANNATATISTSTMSQGYLLVTDGSNGCCLLRFQGYGNNLIFVDNGNASGGTPFSVTPGTASKTNIYGSGGTSLIIENKTGSSQAYSISFIGNTL